MFYFADISGRIILPSWSLETCAISSTNDSIFMPLLNSNMWCFFCPKLIRTIFLFVNMVTSCQQHDYNCKYSKRTYTLAYATHDLCKFGDT